MKLQIKSDVANQTSDYLLLSSCFFANYCFIVYYAQFSAIPHRKSVFNHFLKVFFIIRHFT